jgi:hypothetical protein
MRYEPQTYRTGLHYSVLPPHGVPKEAGAAIRWLDYSRSQDIASSLSEK